MRRDVGTKAEGVEAVWLAATGAIGAAFSKEAGDQVSAIIEKMRHALDCRPLAAAATSNADDVFAALTQMGAKVSSQ